MTIDQNRSEKGNNGLKLGLISSHMVRCGPLRWLVIPLIGTFRFVDGTIYFCVYLFTSCMWSTESVIHKEKLPIFPSVTPVTPHILRQCEAWILTSLLGVGWWLQIRLIKTLSCLMVKLCWLADQSVPASLTRKSHGSTVCLLHDLLLFYVLRCKH